jgi:hypothetical protein
MKHTKSGKAKVMSTKTKTPYTGELPSTNKSSRKNSTDYRPQPK